MAKDAPAIPEDYGELLEDLKVRIRAARVKAALAVNSELVLLYWGIGRDILARQDRQGWGTKVVDRLASDLRETFPEMKGLSPRNLLFMRSLAQTWPEEAIVKQLVSQLPWGHNIRLIQKVKDPIQREWYARACVDQGWSRNVLEMQVESGLYSRQGAAGSNFERTLPQPQSDLAQETLKDPYSFEFLTTADLAHERAIELGLVANIRDFLLELGEGFAFVGNQVKLEVGGEDFYVDLLFYHLKLRAYVVIELKAGAFKPEYVGKLNFYVSAADDLLRHTDDNQTIGLLLCRDKNRVIAEYALRGTTQPMGISGFTLSDEQLAALEKKLPTVEELERELDEDN